MFSFRTTPLEDQLDKALLQGKVACFCTQNSWDSSKGRYVYDIFSRRGNLATIFMPRGAELTSDTNHIDFDAAQLKDFDAVVVEIQDVGSRYFNYTKDVLHLMEALKLFGDEAPAMYVVDHLNAAGRVVEGTIPAGTCELHVPQVAHRHGLTLGEICNLYYNEIGAKFPLHVISALSLDDSRRHMPWTVAPASDIPGFFTCMLYSGGGLWNNTTITPGIGTARPYEYIGAPFIKHSRYEVLPCPSGATIRPCSFSPSCGRYEGQWCQGYQIMIEPGIGYHSLMHTLELMRYFTEHYSEFELSDDFFIKLADPALSEYVLGNLSVEDAKEHIKTEEQKWIRKAKRFCLYDDLPYRLK